MVRGQRRPTTTRGQAIFAMMGAANPNTLAPYAPRDYSVLARQDWGGMILQEFRGFTNLEAENARLRQEVHTLRQQLSLENGVGQAAQQPNGTSPGDGGA